jgi:predicted membrane-bound spermidine synthase
VFFFSGMSSLIYQVAWQRLLTVYYGVGAVSITLIVSIFMLGLGLGALWGGRLAESTSQRIRLYQVIELALAVFGLLSLPFLDTLGRLSAGSNLIVAGIVVSLFLLIPTLLMGMTLPLLTKFYSTHLSSFLETVSFLYFINTLGAAAGALLASYVIISWCGLSTAIFVAVGLNLLVALLLFERKQCEKEDFRPAIFPEPPRPGLPPSLSYALAGVSGFLAIGYEIAWFRVTGILVKASPYAFSTVLAVYLLGIACGSYGTRRYLRRNPGFDRRAVYFLLQAGVGLYVLASISAFYYLTRYTVVGELTRLSFRSNLHPYPLVPSLESAAQIFVDFFSLTDVVLWPVFFVLIPTLLMGASFPLITALALVVPNRQGQTMGTVYFWNVCGNVFGGIVTGFIILPYLGSERTLLGFGCTSLLIGVFADRFRGRRLTFRSRALTATFALLLAVVIFPGSKQLYQAMHPSPAIAAETHIEEGLNGVIVTYKNGEEIENYINGLGHGVRPGTVYMMMTIEALTYSPSLENVLIIGYGAGSITEMVRDHEEVADITVVELNASLLRNLRKMEIFNRMLDDQRQEIVIDDGRRYLIRSERSFDLILMDPIRSTSSYSNNLYSREFFELVATRLRPGGVLMVWLDNRRVLPRTISTVFPYMRWYTNFCLASDRPLRADNGRREIILSRYTGKTRETIDRAADQYWGDQTLVERATKGYPINEDWRPVCEYYLGLRLREWLTNDKMHPPFKGPSHQRYSR